MPIPTNFDLGPSGAGTLNGPVREPPVLSYVDETRVRVGDRTLVSFTGSDYLRLSWHPAVRRAAVRAVREFGTGACASRMTTGNLPVYGELEDALTGFFGVESATLTSAGYTAPLVVGQALASEHDRVLLDSRAHGCLRDAAALTGLKVTTFEYGQPDDLARQLDSSARGGRALVFCDGLGAVDGRVPPLRQYREVLGKRGTLVVDDAHGVGVLGAEGRGSVEWSGLSFRGLVVTMTLSKAFGTYGGVVLGDRRLRNRILERSRLFTGNTPLAPPSASAALEALRVMQRQGTELRERLRRRLASIPEGLRGASPTAPSGPGPMFAVAPRTAAGAARLGKDLLDAGIYPPQIRYPNGPAARFFRFAVSSAHTEAQVAGLVSVLDAFARREGKASR